MAYLLILFGFSFLKLVHSLEVPFQEKYFSQNIDHFRFYNTDFKEKTFPQRYLIQDKWWRSPDGPIFFYTGNEGPIDEFWANTGFVFDIAPQFKALVIFAEHRFYGKSLPFNASVCFHHPYVDVLTVEQALADYAVLLTSVQHQLNATGPVIAFGGSYGGMLTAYMRFKYPNIIHGGIAASAPVYLVAGLTDRKFFFADVTKDFHDAGCEKEVRTGFNQLSNMAQMGTKGYKSISAIFKLCSALQNQTDYRHMLLWLRNAFTNLAMFDYPYPTQMIVSLPANPVKVACDSVLHAKSAVEGLSAVAGLYYGVKSCHNLQTEYVECSDPTGCGTGPDSTAWDYQREYVECSDPTGCGTGLDSMAWDYQACTELAMPAGSNNITDMFPVLSFTLKQRQEYCTKTWATETRDNWINTQMWGNQIRSSSNLVFSNGNLDPWHRGGVLQNVSSSIIAVIVEGGAHHLDLRGSHPLDPPSVKSVRHLETDQIHAWIQQYYTHRRTT